MKENIIGRRQKRRYENKQYGKLKALNKFVETNPSYSF